MTDSSAATPAMPATPATPAMSAAFGSASPASPELSSGRRRAARILAVVVIVIGALFLIAGGAAWLGVSAQLRAENVTVSDEAAFLQGSDVADPLSAAAQAHLITEDALAMADGKTYAELERDDPIRDTVAQAASLRSSLYTSMVSFGVALFAAGVGAVFVLLGAIALIAVPRPVRAG
ncbi:aromatic ring-opening dioxygenase LigA [Agromyces archimandritae]|uniref:aromatic ring-opening dioxygenase LigA n=1 Tax=Agromyces archimandritae TaxID=2781962 RepID=UPI001FD2A106|nr:aromatic ring-opening dioxygenase LigA [Agromyces archimandritae]